MAYRHALAAIIAIAVVRVLFTYAVFSQTSDEPAHIASGLAWLDRGTYVADLEHPPLARIATALVPFLSGIRSVRTGNFFVDGNVVLHANDRYLWNLSTARAGILPFFVLAILLVGAWARSLAGDAAGIAAAALFSNEPSVLAHAGLATTDVAAVTGTMAAAYVFDRWLARDAETRFSFAAFFGVVVGMALLTKFSVWLFLPVVFLVLMIARRRIPRRFVMTVVVSMVLAALTIWAGYRFSLGRTARLGDQHAASKLGPAGVIPAPELVGGINTVRMHAERGHPSFLFGEFSDRGWWYYFPVVIALKTTIGFLALLAFAVALAWKRRELRAPLMAGAAILVVSMPVTINIGVRHVLPVYAFFSVAAGVGLVVLIERRRALGVAVAVFCIVPSLAAHPDYIAYFNVVTPKPAHDVVIDSNLDWGQDMLRLKRELDRRGIQRIGLVCFGTAELDRLGFPTIARVDPWLYTPGWIAVSEMTMKSPDGEYRWLDTFQPVARIGKSIRLYSLPSFQELFGGVRPPSDDMSGFLMPVWFEGVARGSGWRSELVISNSRAEPVLLRAERRPDAPVIGIVPGSGSFTNPPLSLTNTYNGAMLYVSSEDAASLHFALTLHAPDGSTITIPVVREEDASPTLRFPSVLTGRGSRVTLRIYDLTGNSTESVVELNGVSRTVNLTRRDANDAGLTLNSRTLDSIFGEIAATRSSISVDVGSPLGWAFITVTDANGTYVVLPD